MTTALMAPESNRPEYADLGDAIFRARRRKRWSQVELAAEAGELSDSFISRVEAGKARPSSDTLRVIADSLGLDFNELSGLAGYADRPSGDEPIMAPSEVAPYVRRLLRYPVDVWQKLELTAGAWVTGQKPPSEEASDEGDEAGDAEAPPSHS